LYFCTKNGNQNWVMRFLLSVSYDVTILVRNDEKCFGFLQKYEDTDERNIIFKQ